MIGSVSQSLRFNGTTVFSLQPSFETMKARIPVGESLTDSLESGSRNVNRFDERAQESISQFQCTHPEDVAAFAFEGNETIGRKYLVVVTANPELDSQLHSKINAIAEQARIPYGAVEAYHQEDNVINPAEYRVSKSFQSLQRQVAQFFEETMVPFLTKREESAATRNFWSDCLDFKKRNG